MRYCVGLRFCVGPCSLGGARGARRGTLCAPAFKNNLPFGSGLGLLSRLRSLRFCVGPVASAERAPRAGARFASPFSKISSILSTLRECSWIAPGPIRSVPRAVRERSGSAAGTLRERFGNVQRTLSIKTVSTWETHQTLKPTFPNPTDQNPKHSGRRTRP